jgi:hypothetical protein
MELSLQNFLIRSFAERDRLSLKNLWEGCGLMVHYNNPDQDIDFAVKSPNSTIFVGEAGIAFMASVMVGHDGHRGWLYYLAVDEHYQRSGYGRAMVSAAEKWLKGEGVRKSMLLLRETNVSVEAFYKRLGYETIPRTVMQRWLT